MDSMATGHLRVYYGPEQSDRMAGCDRFRQPSHRVTVPLKDVVSALAHAVRHQRTWLADFQDDEVTISTDLYEVILAYQYYHAHDSSVQR
jgi:hypothetical protein